LDIGSSTGFFLDEARKYDWDVYGVEPSGWATAYAKDKLGITQVCLGLVKDAHYPDNFFDAVTMIDTIEHLADPKEVLVEIRRILKPDGMLCVNTPDIASLPSKILKARWWGIKQYHMYYFTSKTLKRMLEATGFVPVKITSHARTFSLGYWLDRFQMYNQTVYRMFSLLLKVKIVRGALFTVDFKDQLEVYAKKMRAIEFLDELERPPYLKQRGQMKTIAIMPSYNAAKTLAMTVRDIPKDAVDECILVNDASTDDTVAIAQQLGLKVVSHPKNRGYGAGQKTGYDIALEDGADIVVMVHPDYQYDPKAITALIEPIKQGRADAVFGSRMMKGGALEGGMPLWKHNSNILLTAAENVCFGTFLTEYHSGFRAYSAQALRKVKYQLNSDKFMFDTEIIAQLLIHHFKIEEIPIKTRYFDEASTMRIVPCLRYGLGILKTMLKYFLHTRNIVKFKQFS